MNYSEFVRSRFKSGEKIAEEMTPHKTALLLMQVEDVIEESQYLDRVKKYAIYNDDKYGLSKWKAPVSAEIKFKNSILNPSQCELLHAAIGIAGEAGELLDAVRKHVFEGEPLDEDNLKEEAGDIIFYLEALIQTMRFSVHEIITGNMAKLSKRYDGGYSDKQAQERKDKQ